MEAKEAHEFDEGLKSKDPKPTVINKKEKAEKKEESKKPQKKKSGKLSKDELKEITTKKQRKVLKSIKEKCGVPFPGSTQEEVRQFIEEWLPRTQNLAQLNDIFDEISDLNDEYVR